jgi:transcriptional regulator with XRE-family HTH domain
VSGNRRSQAIRECAERMGISENRVTDLLEGDGNLRVYSLAKLAHALGYTVNIALRAIENYEDETD